MSEALTTRLVALVSSDLYNGIIKVAAAQRRSKAAVVRAALTQYVSAWERQNEKKGEKS